MAKASSVSTHSKPSVFMRKCRQLPRRSQQLTAFNGAKYWQDTFMLHVSKVILLFLVTLQSGASLPQVTRSQSDFRVQPPASSQHHPMLHHSNSVPTSLPRTNSTAQQTILLLQLCFFYVYALLFSAFATTANWIFAYTTQSRTSSRGSSCSDK